MPFSFYFQWLTRYPPLGLLYSSAILKEQGHSVKLVDAEFMGYSLKRVKEILTVNKPDIICCSVYVFSPAYELECLKKLKQDLDFILICRGHFPRLYPIQTIENNHVDFAFTGKGFYSIGPLIKALELKKTFEQVPGIIYKKDNKIIQTQQEPDLNLNDMPFPSRELIDNSIYTTCFTLKDRFTTLMASTGCPYSCSYCAEKNAPYIPRDVDKIIAELKQCKDDHKIKEVFFFDLIFNLDRIRTIDFCKKLKEAKLNISWSFRTRPDLIDEQLLDILANSGCVKIHYGIESGNQEILNKLNRKITLEQMRKTIALTTKKKIATFGYFMIGNDGETKETAMDTINFAKSLPLLFAQFAQAAPIPNSGILKINNEKFKNDLWLENYKTGKLSAEQLRPQNTSLSSKELKTLINKAYCSFYLAPKRIWRILFFKYTPYYVLRQFKILFILIKVRLSNIYFKKSV